ncbi:MAG: glycosyltransferase [Bacillota bacterium]
MKFSGFDFFSFIGSKSISGKLYLLAVVLFFVVFFYVLAKHSNGWKKLFIVLSIAMQIAYIAWRAFFTLPVGNTIGLIAGILLLCAEMLGAFQAAMHRILYLREPFRAQNILPETLPDVDVLICIYNEPAKVIEKTVAAAVAMQYPKEKLHVYVCDDGRREEIRRIAKRFGAEWVTRPDNAHAKAGNLNNCLKTAAKSEFFLILDADVVVRSHFLQRTIGCFTSDKIAFVQAPQVFYTPDPFQYNLSFNDSIPNEQDYFMREIQPRRAAYDATLFVGSNGLFRRSCIDEIGLIPIESITEDIATSLVLQSHGYSGVTVDEVLAVGLSAESFADYVSQHERWGRGNIQVLKRYKPLTRKGLTLMQRMLYFDGIIYWFFGLQKLVYIVCPILFLLTGIPIFFSDFYTMLLMFVPTFVMSLLMIRMFSYKSRNLGWAHIYETAMAPRMALSAALELLFSFKLKFRVTPKGQSRRKRIFSHKMAFPHILLAMASFAALLLGITKAHHDAAYMIPVYVLNLFWIVYNLYGLVLNIFVCFEKPRFRNSERLSVDAPVTVLSENSDYYPATAIDMSETGCALTVHTDDEMFFLLKRELSLVLRKGAEPIPLTVVRAEYATRFVAFRYRQLNTQQYIDVVQFIFNRQKSGYGAFKNAQDEDARASEECRRAAVSI